MRGDPLDRQQHVADSCSQTQPPRFCHQRPICSRRANGQAAVQEQEPCRRCCAEDGSVSNMTYLRDGRLAGTRRAQQPLQTRAAQCVRMSLTMTALVP